MEHQFISLRPKEAEKSPHLGVCRWPSRGRTRCRLWALHGFHGDALDFAGLFPFLPDEVELLGIDLLGHGTSSRSAQDGEYLFPKTVDWLERVAEAVGGGPDVLLGYSMGGRIALNYMLVGGQAKSLVLVGANPGLCSQEAIENRRCWEQELIERLTSGSMEDFCRYWSNLPIIKTQSEFMSEELWLALQLRRRKNDPRALISVLRGLGTGQMPSLWNRLKGLKVPVAYFVGDQDFKYQQIGEKFVTHACRAQLTKIPNSGHASHLENPMVFGEELSSFILDKGFD